MSAISDIQAREILDSPRQPDRRGRGRARFRRVRPGGRAVRRLDRRARGRRAARRRPTRYGGKGVLQGRRRTSTTRSPRSCSGIDADDQRLVDQTLIDLDGTPNKCAPRRQRHPGRLAGRGQGRRGRAGLPLYHYVGGAVARTSAGADDEHHQRRRARRQQHRPAGVHGHAGRRADSFAEALRMGAEVFHALKSVLQGRGPATPCRRRGRLRPEPEIQRRGARTHRRGHREGRLQAGRRRLARPRPGRHRVLQATASYVLAGEGKTLDSAEHGRLLRRLVDKYPDRLDRGRHGRGRLGRLEAADRRPRRPLQIVGDDLFVTNTERLARGHRDGHRQLDPDQGQPDRHAVRDARRRRDGHNGRLHGGDVAPLGRDRGPTIADLAVATNCRPDQDRRACPLATASPSTTSCCASRRRWVRWRRYAGRTILKAGRRAGDLFDPPAPAGATRFFPGSVSSCSRR